MINRKFIANTLRLLSKQILAVNDNEEHRIPYFIYINNSKDKENEETLSLLKKFDDFTQSFLKQLDGFLKSHGFTKKSEEIFKEKDISGKKYIWTDVAEVNVSVNVFNVLEGEPSSLISSCCIEDKKYVLISPYYVGIKEDKCFEVKKFGFNLKLYKRNANGIWGEIVSIILKYMDKLNNSEQKS